MIDCLRAAPYGCDMSGWVRHAGIPTVLYGPGRIDVSHAPNEWVSLETTYNVARTLVRTTEQLLETPDLQNYVEAHGRVQSPTQVTS